MLFEYSFDDQSIETRVLKREIHSLFLSLFYKQFEKLTVFVPLPFELNLWRFPRNIN